MKKRDRMLLIAYIIIGAAMAACGITGKNGFFDSGALFIMGVLLIAGSLAQLIRSWHNRKPENRESYETEMRRQRIEWDDERNMQIRHYAGYLTYGVTMAGCFMAAVITNLLGVGDRIVFILLLAGAAEGVMFTVFQWYARRKM